MGNKQKSRKNIVYSTNPDFEYEHEGQEEESTLAPREQDLRVSLDRKNRKGKTVTLIEGFIGTHDDLKALAKTLKAMCGTGGSIDNGHILIQGDFREKVMNWLEKEGFGAKRKGG